MILSRPFQPADEFPEVQTVELLAGDDDGPPEMVKDNHSIEYTVEGANGTQPRLAEYFGYEHRDQDLPGYSDKAKLKLKTHRRKKHTADRAFPPQLNNLAFVAGAHRVSKVAGMSFQIFDLALYVERENRLWHKENSLKELQNLAPGHALIRIKVTSGLVNAKRLATSLDSILRRHLENDARYHEALDKFVNLVEKGPKLSVGSIIDLFLLSTGVHINVDDNSLTDEVKEPALSKAFIAMYADEKPDIVNFKEDIYKNLRLGWKSAEHTAFQRMKDDWQVELPEVSSWSSVKTLITIFSVLGLPCLETRGARNTQLCLQT